MTVRRAATVLLALGALLGGAAASRGAAAPATAPAGPCEAIAPAFDELTNVQHNQTQDYLANLRAELAVRKRILTDTIDCAMLKAQQFRDTVQSLPAPASGELASLYLGKIDEVLAYYRLREASIGDLGIQGSRDVARSLKDWRDANVAPLAALVGDLTIWAKNQALMKTAESRLDQVNQMVQVLRLADNADIENGFREAQAHFAEAKQLNDRARQALERLGTVEDPLPVIKASLEALSTTYQSLFDLGDIVKKVLPQ
jgi:hypothetical protein